MNKLTTILLGAAMIAGCQTNKPHLADSTSPEPQPDHAEHEKDLAFFSEERKQTPAVKSILARQMDNGAAADGMLRAMHFDGAELNSLGTSKLDAIIRGTSGSQPVAVHLDLYEEGDQTTARHEAVIVYLAEQGIEADRAQVRTGDNPATRHLATLTASKRYKVEDRALGSTENELDTASTTRMQVGSQSRGPVPPTR